MDRFCSGILPLLYRHCQWPSHRCRLFSNHHFRRCRFGRSRNIHDFTRPDLLANTSCARDLYWPRQWSSPYPDDGAHHYIFSKKACACHGDRSLWEHHRRSYLPQHGKNLATKYRFWMDHASDWLCTTGHICYCLGVRKAKKRTQSLRSPGRLGCIQGD